MTEIGILPVHPKLGRHVSIDTRDQNFPLRAAIPERIVRPPTKYWHDPWVGDQHEGSCTGQCGNGHMQASPINTKNLDPLDIYHGAQRFDEWPGENYEGSSIRGVADFLKSEGHIQEYRWVDPNRLIDDMLDWLAVSGTLMAGTVWYNSMFEDHTDRGIIPVDQASGVAGGHAWLILGYNLKAKCFRMVNSWGRGWQQKGRAWITFADFEKLFAEDGEVCAAIERKVA